jgi:hypothetical protein
MYSLELKRAIPAADASLPAARPSDSDWRTTVLHVGLILFVGTMARIPFYFAYRPIWSGDSRGYLWAYLLWTRRLFMLGERTPVYPLFLGWVNSFADVQLMSYPSLHFCYTVAVLQSALSVLSAVVLYFTFHFLRVRPGLALGASLFFASIPGICFYDLNILNMSMASSLLTLTAALYLATLRHIETNQGTAIPALATGVALSLAILNRPEFLIFAILLILMQAAISARCWKSGSTSYRGVLRVAVLFTLAPAAAVLGWMFLVYIGIGQFRITTLDGWNRTRTVYNMFDRVSPEDRAIGGIMARTYQEMERTNAKVNLREIMWPAQEEMFANFESYPIADTASDPAFLNRPFIQAGRRNLGLIQVSCEAEAQIYCWKFMRRKIDTGDYLGRISWKLARKYPGDWLRNVSANYFEESFNFRYLEPKPAVEGYHAYSGDRKEIIQDKNIVRRLTGAMNIEAPFLTLTYLITLGCFAVTPMILFRDPDQYWLNDMAVCTLAVASVGTIVGTCVLAGFNRVYTLQLLVVFAICSTYAAANRSRILATIRHTFPLKHRG